MSNLQAQVINAGVGGNATKDLMKRVQNDVINQNPDMVIIMVGTNDMLNSKKMVSYSDYKANLTKIINEVQTNKNKIVLVAPPTADSVYLFERHDRKDFKEAPNVKLDSVRMIMKDLAKEYKLNFVDVYSKFAQMNLPQHNEDMFIRNMKNSNHKDGVHLTIIGYKLLATTVFEELKNRKLLKKNQKIICFGDSLTNGSGVIKENAYPAVLNKLISESGY